MKKKILVLLFIGILFLGVGCQKNPTLEDSSNISGLTNSPIAIDTDEKVLSPAPTMTQIPSETVTPTITTTKKPTPTVIQEPSPTMQPTSAPIYVSEGEHAQTIMIYMVGSDLESSHAAGSYDLLEMVNAEADITHNNVIIYTGGSSQWYIEGLSSEQDSILLLGENGLSIADVLEEQNMGRAETLAMFINYCMEKFDSETYSLILWNHGAGPVLGYGLDEKSNDILSLLELGTALELSVGKQGKSLEWIGFDACLMSSLEVVDVVAPYANYMIASQETEPGWGWCYIFLNALSNKVFQDAELEKAIIDLYMYYGDFVFAEQPQMYTDLTLSCIDLKRYQKVEEALNKYFEELANNLNTESYAEIVRARNQLRELGSYSTTFQYGMVDLVELLKKLPQTTLGIQALNAVEDMIVYSCSNMDNVHGISICYPTNSTEDYEILYSKVQCEIGFAEGYGEFLLALKEVKQGESLTRTWNFEGAVTSATEISGADKVCTSDIAIQLTEEQAKNFACARFTILKKITENDFYTKERYPRLDEMYVLMFQGADVTLDENNILHAYYGNEVIYVHDLTENTYSDVPFLLKEVERTDTEIRYHIYGLLQDFSGENISEWKIAQVEIQVAVSVDYPNGIIRGIVPFGEEGEINAPAKQLLQLDEFSLLTVLYPIRYYTEGKNGDMIAYSEWEASPAATGIEVNLEHEFVLEKCPIDDPENYVCIFEIIDLQGNASYSELIPLK